MKTGVAGPNIMGIQRRRKRRTLGDWIFDIFAHTVVALAAVITVYPFIYVLSMSISSPDAVIAKEVFFLPKGFDLSAYRVVFADNEVWRGYGNTLWYTSVGTALNLLFTLLAAFALSKKRFFARRFFTFIFVFTMFFSGGMIPLFIVVVRLGLYNTRWAMICVSLVTTWNLIICRTFFESLPEDLFESARLDGAGEWYTLFRIALPLSTPVIAVLTLFYAVGWWNSWFMFVLYSSDQSLQPLQIYLRRVLITATPESLKEQMPGGVFSEMAFAMLKIRYTVIIITVLPIITVYPFLQKYFVKGVMIGALKG